MKAAAEDPDLLKAQQKLAAFDDKTAMRMRDLEQNNTVRYFAGNRAAYEANKGSLSHFTRSNIEELMNRNDERAQLVSNYNQVKASVTGTKDTQVAAAEEQKRLAGVDAQKKLDESRKLYREKNENEQTAANERLRQMEQERIAAVEELKGQAYAAEKRRLESRMQGELQANRQAEKEALQKNRDDPEKVRLIQSQAEAARREITNKGIADRAALDKKYYMDARGRAFEAGQTIAQAQEEARLEQMRKGGEGRAADVEALKDQAAREKARIQEELDRGLLEDNTDADAKRAKAKAEQDKIDAKLTGDLRRQEEENRAGTAAVNRQLGTQELTSMRARAARGDIKAASEAARLEVRERFAARRDELEKMIHDEKVNPAQRQKAAGLLAGLDQEEAKALATAGLSGSYKLPTLAEAGRTSGFAQRFAEQHNIQFTNPMTTLVKAQEAANIEAKGIHEAVKRTADLLQNMPPMRALLAGKR
jgi:hypothetical protein